MLAEHAGLFFAILLLELVLTFGVMVFWGRWLVRNTRPKHGHCPPNCICRRPDYVWPRRRSTDIQDTNRRATDAVDGG